MRATPASPQTNPFPGLRPFREDEEHLFFGRENQVDAMVNKLAATRFLAVVGTSGSGKSSLVNCGLRPALRQGLMARAGTAWRMAQFRPGNDPIGAMARALAQDGVLFREQAAAGLSLAEIIETTLRMSKLGLIDIREQAALEPGVNLLVVVDQFEELFRYRQVGNPGSRDAEKTADAAAFVNLLLEARERADLRIFVVLTMRSDFLGDCTQFPGSGRGHQCGPVSGAANDPGRAPRRHRGSDPCGRRGDRAGVADAAGQRRRRQSGPVVDPAARLEPHLGVLAGEAAKVLWSCGTMKPSAAWPARSISMRTRRMPNSAAHGSSRSANSCSRRSPTRPTIPRGVRRPTTLATLCALADASAAEVTDVIDVFRKPSRSFLMPPAGDALEPETVIDISHESLMRVWQRLITWAEEEARSARTYCRLADASDLYAESKVNLGAIPNCNWRWIGATRASRTRRGRRATIPDSLTPSGS